MRPTYVLILLSFVFTSAAKSQTLPAQTTPQKSADCACESQVLPETLAILNGV